MGYTIKNVKNVIRFCAEIASCAKDELEQIDSKTGDGDLGISIQKGAAALAAVIESYEDDSLGRFFSLCAMELNKAAPSTMGTLLSAGFMQMGREYLNCTELHDSDIMEIPAQFAAAITAMGKAGEGDRTILDALFPICRAFDDVRKKGGGVTQALIEGKDAAAEGAEKTRQLVPKVGRSKWIPENAAGEIDGGARFCSILADALAKKYSENRNNYTRRK